MNVIDSLIKLGLSKKAAMVYMAGLELGTASVQALAIKTKVRRTTVYTVIDELKNLGLVKETIKGKKRRLVFVHPNQLKVLENDREAALEQSFAELQKLAAQSPGKPKVEYAESLTEIQKLYESALRTAETDTIGVADTTTSERLGITWLEGYIKKRNQKKLKGKVVLAGSGDIKKWQDKNQDDNREMRVVSGKNLPINLEVIGDTVIITSLDGESIGLAIESKKVAEGMRGILEIIWEQPED